MEVHCRGNVVPNRITANLEPLTEVVAAYTVSGAADAIVHLRAADIHHLETALERLRAWTSSTGRCPPSCCRRCWNDRRCRSDTQGDSDTANRAKAVRERTQD